MHAHARKAAPARRRPDKTTARGWEGACTVRPSVRGSGSGSGSRCTAPALLATCKQKAAGGWRLVGPLLCCAVLASAARVQCSAMGRTRNRTAAVSVPVRSVSTALSQNARRRSPSVRACATRPVVGRPSAQRRQPACLARRCPIRVLLLALPAPTHTHALPRRVSGLRTRRVPA